MFILLFFVLCLLLGLIGSTCLRNVFGMNEYEILWVWEVVYIKFMWFKIRFLLLRLKIIL